MSNPCPPYPLNILQYTYSVYVLKTNVCNIHLSLQALASLAEAAYEAVGGDEDPETYLLSQHFSDIIQHLVKTADR